MSPDRSPTRVERLNKLGITPVNIVLIYLFVGAGWNLYSDLLINALIKDPYWLEKAYQYKGWVFLAGTGVVLLILLQEGIFALRTIRQQTILIKEKQLVAESFRDIIQLINTSPNTANILQGIVEKAKEILNAQAIAIYYLNPVTNICTIQSSTGLSDDYIKISHISLGEAATGRAILTKAPVPIKDLRKSDTENLSIDSHSQTLINHLMGDFLAVLAIPLIGQENKAQGSITLYYAEPQDFQQSDIELAEIYGNQAMLAITTDNLRQQIQAATRIEERNRLARELHDSVTQTLYSIMLFSNAASLANDQNKTLLLNDHLNSVQSMAQEALRNMRLLIFELYPPKLKQEGIINAIRARLEAVEARSGYMVELHVLSECNLPIEIESQLYQICIEAISNVLKHAKATKLDVTLQQTEDTFYLAIQDNGIGLNTEEIGNGGWGIPNIKSRVNQMDGTIHFTSQPSQGTNIEVWVPLPANENLSREDWISDD